MILRHRKLPCVFVWNDPIESWEKRIKRYLQEEIKHEGFKNFILEEEKTEVEKSEAPAADPQLHSFYEKRGD